MKYTYDEPLWKRVLRLIIICVLYFAVSVAAGAAVSTASDFADLDNETIYQLFQFLSALVSIAVTLLFLRAGKSQRGILATITAAFPGNHARNVCFGALLGAAGYLGYLLIPLAAGGISLTFAPVSPVTFLIAVLAVLAMALSEELDNRVFLFQNLRRTFRSPAAAVAIAAVWFTVSHGVTDILSLLFYLSGAVVFLLMVYGLESTWCAYAFHISWNLLALIFGESGAGFFAMTSTASPAASFFQPDLSMGGDLPGVIINMVMIAVILLKCRTKQAKQIG